MPLVPFEAGYVIPLRRAPDVRQACVEAGYPTDEPFVLSLRELLVIISSAREWREKGVVIPALDARTHPRYGVFSPVRGGYVDLVAKAPVLAALLARRGVGRVVASDQDARVGMRPRERDPLGADRSGGCRRSGPLPWRGLACR
jgi:hypothetical protein